MANVTPAKHQHACIVTVSMLACWCQYWAQITCTSKVQPHRASSCRLLGQVWGCFVKWFAHLKSNVWLTNSFFQDYFHKLVFVTDQDRFEVPVRAIGPRAILDFPDELRLPLCPVKASTEKTHFVRNVGNSKANFTLHTQRLESILSVVFDWFDILQYSRQLQSYKPLLI